MKNNGRYKDITFQEILELIEQNNRDKKEANRITKQRNEKASPIRVDWNRNDLYSDVLSNQFVEGFVMEYPHGNVVRQAQSSFYYRGENQIFESSKASLFRKLSIHPSTAEKLVEKFVAYMRIADFKRLLFKFDHVLEFVNKPLDFNNKAVDNRISLLHEQIAQHYGLDTPWLDITSDFEVALFFACCKYDGYERRWLPLNESDFMNNEAKQYGVIFRQPSVHPNNLQLSNSTTQILPVGFQPFMRCNMQSSYVAKLDESKSLQDDLSFEMLRFKHTERLSNFIFKKMKKGRMIYPHEGLNAITDHIDSVRDRKTFSTEVLNFTLRSPHFQDIEKEKILGLLVQYGYQISDVLNDISKNKVDEVNYRYRDFDIEKTYSIKLSSRLTF